MREDAKIARLKAIPLFAEADTKHLSRIAQLCTEITISAGSVLCREGEPGREMFILEQGQVSVTVGGREVATLSDGDHFGELALLDGQARNATVTATSDLRVLVLERGEFSALLHDEPSVATRMLSAVGARLRTRVQPGDDVLV